MPQSAFALSPCSEKSTSAHRFLDATRHIAEQDSATPGLKESAALRLSEQGGQSHSIESALSCRAIASSVSLDHQLLGTYLQGEGYDFRQCRADTQLAMIGVSIRGHTLLHFSRKLYS